MHFDAKQVFEAVTNTNPSARHYSLFSWNLVYFHYLVSRISTKDWLLMSNCLLDQARSS